MKSMYSQVFDSKCPLWDKNQKFNLLLLQSKQTYFNDLLKMRGYVFLRDIYEDLGFPITLKTLFVGWVYDLENPMKNRTLSWILMLMELLQTDLKRSPNKGSFFLQ